ncbi:MAG: SDR family NAD(P)-dependent oxidoreductase, partial [Betaproteobacteria bacterium]|nr:SDR family NAD(P)-dependent oxidoreductase [Betaproteobacteria bacterium]
MLTALVTGAGRGIGLATAKAFLAAGWRVIALDKDFSRFDATGAVERLQYDLTDIAGIPA